MLTNSQLWRRLKSRRTQQRLKHEAEYLNDCVDSENCLNHQKDAKLSATTVSNSTDNRTSTSDSSSSGRKVKFSSVIRVCLVPCRSDFLSDFNALFWMREDYQSFKEDAVRELRAHWLTNRTSVKEAIIDLYQPRTEDFLASKTLMSHVDSVAQLPLVAIIPSIEGGPHAAPIRCTDFTKKTYVEPNQFVQEINYNSPDSSSSTESGSEGAEPWTLSPTSSEHKEGPSGVSTTVSLAATTTSCSSSSSSDIRETTGYDMSGLRSKPPQLDQAAPRKGELFKIVRSTSASAASASAPPPGLQQHASLLSRSSSGTSFISTEVVVPTRYRADRPSSAGSAGSSSNTGTSKQDGVRIIMVDNVSPASSISSFEAPIMIYGQS